MFYQIKNIASLSLTFSLGLAIIASKAQALTFDVSYGVLNNTHRAEGTIQVNDSSLSSKPTNLIKSDFENWDITLTNNKKSATTVLTPANSEISFFPDSPSGILATTDGIAFANEKEFQLGIDYDDMIRLEKEGRGIHLDGTEIFIPMNQEALIASPLAIATSSENETSVGIITSNNRTFTPVPFRISTNTSIIILSGLYGASRLRKKVLRND